MITVNGLTKKYAHTTAVDQISFEVQQGQIVGFLGPNGAGKTTTMRMLTCFLTPTSGTATVAGFDILEQPLEVKKRIGYLPETPPVYPEMRIAEYLSFVGQLKGLVRIRTCAPESTTPASAARSRTFETRSSGNFRKATGSAWAWPRRSSTIPTF